jgi:3D (Asp-Asp-Asp) domain-containing protein
VPVLHRNRRLLIAGVLTILPAAAMAPSLFGPAKSPALLAAVDQMTTSEVDVARTNERAVELASAQQIVTAPNGAKPQALTSAAPALESVTEAETPVMRYFNGRPVRIARTISMLVTAYSPDAQSCGESADGITASGYSVWTNGMKMVAADTSVLPFGTLVSVPGYDEAGLVPVLDRGGAIKGNRLDVLYATHERAIQWGVQRLEVTVWEYADGKPGDFQIASR